MKRLGSFVILSLSLLGVSRAAAAPELEGAFLFGSRILSCETPNEAGRLYTVVQHSAGTLAANVPITYDAGRGWGFEMIYPAGGGPYAAVGGGWGVLGPFDDTPNNRARFPDSCPEQIYDSFIGWKNFLTTCDAASQGGDPNAPCSPPEGGVFRIDVPNGVYRFVGAFGEADNHHAHRIVAEDGGSGPVENIGPNHVVLVHNHDQAQYTNGQARPNPVDDRLGAGVYAQVGFDGKVPPVGDGTAPDPVFVPMDQSGMPAATADSPYLHVTQGYIRIHMLQGNSNNGPLGTDSPRDPNGGDIVVLELWNLGEPPAVPTSTTTGLIVLVVLLAAGGTFLLARRQRRLAVA